MGVHRKQMKGRITYVLLLTLLLTMLHPVGSYADEAEGNVDNAPKEAAVELEEYSEQTEEPAKEDVDSGKISVDGKSIEARANKFESTAPVIEEVDFKQNGTTVKNDSVLTLSLYVYDDSEISDIRADITSEEFGGSEQMEWTKGENEKEYILTYQLDGYVTGKLEIYSIVVVDEHSNLTNYDVYDFETGESKYWVNAEAAASEPIRVKNFSFSRNGQSVETIGEIGEQDISLETDRAIEDDAIYLRFENDKEDNSYCILRLSPEEYGISNQIFDRMWSYSGNSSSGRYVLKKVYLERGLFDTEIPLEMENKEEYSFIITKDPDWSESESKLELESVVLNKNTQQVKQGDEVEITVGVTNKSDEPLPQYGTVYFYAAAPDIDDSSRYVDLTLGEDSKYHGTLKIENMYPCEWYVEDIRIEDDSWYEQEFPDKERYPYYVCVYNEEAFVNPSFDVDIAFMALDKNGDYQIVSEVKKENVERRQTMKEIGVAFPAMKSEYAGLTQTGWIDQEGREITEDMALFNEEYIQIYAKYDKGIIHAYYEYPDAEGNWQSTDQKFLYEHGETYGELLKQINGFVPEDITKEYSFIGWEYEDDYYKEDDVISDRVEYISAAAKFADVTLLRIFPHYFDQEANDDNGSEVLAVKEGTTVNDVINVLSKSEPPQSYEGLRFKEWAVNPYMETEGTAVVKNGDAFGQDAIYENCLIRYIIWSDNGENIYCQVAEKGETVKALTSFDNLGEITWEIGYAPEETFVVNEHMTFYGDADSAVIDPDVPSDPEKPDQPSKPSKPSGSTSDSDNKTDVPEDTKLPDSVVNSVIEKVNNSAPGQTIQVNMNSKTTVSKEILEAARGKDVNVVLEMDGYSWTINGKDIQATNLKDINLKVIKHTDHIPSSTVKALAGSNPCMQISLVHEGNFGFKATLNIGVGSEYAGKYGNLYYHDSAGKMVFINAGQINSEGNVSLEFSHASDYLLVMSAQAMSQTDVPENLMPAGMDQNGTTSASNTNNNVTRSPRTGDYTMVYPWLLLCAAAMGIMIYEHKRKHA